MNRNKVTKNNKHSLSYNNCYYIDERQNVVSNISANAAYGVIGGNESKIGSYTRVITN